MMERIQCPLCPCEMKARTKSIVRAKFARHLLKTHYIGGGQWRDGKSIHSGGIVFITGHCPCCQSKGFDSKEWINHVRKKADPIIAALHAHLLGITP